MTRSRLIPRSREAFWLAAMARMALPMRVFLMKKPRASHQDHGGDQDEDLRRG